MLGTVCCSDRLTAFYKNPFSPSYNLTSCGQFAISRFTHLCDTLHKVREAPFAKGRTRTDLALQGAG